MQFRLDQLSKNILRDFFVLVGAAETEVEELLPGLPSEERDFIMETREWYEQWNARRMQEAKEAEERAQQRGHELGRLQMASRICATRLGRPLTEAETAALAERLERLHENRVSEVVLALSADALAGWLSDPNAS